MAATTAFALSVGTGVYSAIDANQQRQKAKGQRSALLASAPSQPKDNGAAQSAALDAERRTRAQAANKTGYSSTILTGGSGIPPAPITTGGKTLLGS